MATVPITLTERRPVFGPDAAGTLMTPEGFDEADFEEGWRYELVHGVLVVSPSPRLEERDPNQYLGHLLLIYQENHPKGSALDFTVNEHTIDTLENRRRCDRAIWAGRGHLPRAGDPPTIAIEFVSAGKRDRFRDYQEKRMEYRKIGIKEYWIIDRFRHIMTVHLLSGAKPRKRIIREKQVYTTSLLPGFKLPLAELFALADRWAE